MGLFDSLRGLFRKTVKSSLTYQYGNREVYQPIDGEKALTEGYLKNTAVYSIVMKDASKFASIPRYLVKENGDQEEDIQNALTYLLRNPNPNEAEDVFLTKVRAYYKVTGEAFIWLNRGDTAQVNEYGQVIEVDDKTHAKRPVLEMYVLPSNHVTVYPDDTIFGVSGYGLNWTGNNKSVPLRKVDVIHWKSANLNFDPYAKEHLRGFSPLSSGYKTLQQNNDATDATVRMHQNDGAKGVLFNETMDNMTPAQSDQVKAVVNRKINNNDIKGAVATLQGKWGYLDIMSSIDPKLLESKQLTWQELCFLLGVPYEFFDAKTTYANKEMAQRGWITNDIFPACKQLDGEFERALFPAFGITGMKIESDYTELPEMQQDMGKLAETLMKAWPITPDEVREALGYDPIGGEFAEPWVPSGVTPMSQMNDGFDQLQQQLRQSGINDTNQ